MKSKTAAAFVENDTIQMRNGDRMVDASTAYIAIEFAEQEAEDRIRTKAHKIIREMMVGIFHGDMSQRIADEFIQKLQDEF